MTDFIERQFAAPQQKFRKSRAWIVWLVVLVVVVVLAAILDGVARSVVAGTIRDKVRSSLSIPAASRVDVSVGGTSVLWQLAQGSLENVKIDADDVKFGSLEGTATVTARGLPLDQSKSVSNLAVTFAVGDTQLKGLVRELSGFPVTSVATADGVVKVGSEAKLLGIGIPFDLSFTPGASAGKLTLALKSVQYRSATFTPAKFRDTLGALVDPLIKTRSICVANDLPAGFVLDAVTAVGSKLAFTVSGNSVALSSSTLTTKGMCTS
jgi:hypothetical protein